MNITAALWASFVRTVIPAIVGAVLGLVASAGLVADSELENLLTTAIIAGSTALYYLAARLLETYVTPRFGWLLGSTQTPTYKGKHEA